MKSTYLSHFFALVLSFQCFAGVQSFFFVNQDRESHNFVNRKPIGRKSFDDDILEQDKNSMQIYNSRQKDFFSKRNVKIFQMQSLRDNNSGGESNEKKEEKNIPSDTSSSFYFHEETNKQNSAENASNAIEGEGEGRQEIIDVVDEAEESALDNLSGNDYKVTTEETNETEETTSSTKFLRFNKGFGVAKDPPKLKMPKGRKPTTHRMDMRKTPQGSNMGVMPKTSDKPGERVFDLFVEYPCKFQMKVIGLRDENFEKDMVEIVAKVVKKPAESIEYRNRDKGKYRSVTIEAPVENSDQVYECYAKLSEDPRVIYKI